MESIVTFLLTQNPAAATSFYRDKLGLNFLRDDGFALVFEWKGIMLRISKVESFTPAQHTVLGWECVDLPSEVKRLAGLGITFERYPGMGQDESGIATFPTGDSVAWLKDPDGNVLSLSHHVAS